MAKLTLNIDTLDVQTFETGETVSSQGTVRAHGGANTEACGSWEADCTAAYRCTEAQNTFPAETCYTSIYEVCPILPPKKITDFKA